jgi:hypothetical protein
VYNAQYVGGQIFVPLMDPDKGKLRETGGPLYQNKNSIQGRVVLTRTWAKPRA